MGEFLDNFKNEAVDLLRHKKNLVNLLLLGILILGIPLGVELLRRQQILKSRADIEPIVFVESNDLFQKVGKWFTKKPQISLQITSPLGPPAPPPTPTPPPPSPTPPPPGPVSNLQVSCLTGGNAVNFSWSAVAGTINYIVRVNDHDDADGTGWSPTAEASGKAGGDFTNVAPFTANVWNNVTVAPGHTYDWSVQVCRTGETSPCAAEKVFGPGFNCTATATPPPVASKIISYEAFHYTGASGQKILQSIIAEDSRTWSRTCTVSGDTVSCPQVGEDTNKGWKTGPNLTAPDGTKIISYGAFSYTGSSGQKIIQSIIAGDSRTWARTCTVSGDSINCPVSGWVAGPNLTAPDGTKIISYGAFSYTGSSGQKIIQSIIAGDSRTWARTCTVSGDTVSCPQVGEDTNKGWKTGPLLVSP